MVKRPIQNFIWLLDKHKGRYIPQKCVERIVKSNNELLPCLALSDRKYFKVTTNEDHQHIFGRTGFVAEYMDQLKRKKKCFITIYLWSKNIPSLLWNPHKCFDIIGLKISCWKWLMQFKFPKNKDWSSNPMQRGTVSHFLTYDLNIFTDTLSTTIKIYYKQVFYCKWKCLKLYILCINTIRLNVIPINYIWLVLTIYVISEIKPLVFQHFSLF